MIFEATSNLIYLINKQIQNLKIWGVAFNVSGLLLLVKFYYTPSSNDDMQKLIAGMLLSATCFFFAPYLRMSPFGNHINKTALTVEISGDAINVTTSPCKVLYWIRKKPQNIAFKIESVKMLRIAYPIRQILDLNDGAIKVYDSHNEVYVIPFFFDETLLEQLRQIQSQNR